VASKILDPALGFEKSGAKKTHMYKYNLRNPSCFAGYDYDTTSIILHTSTNAMFPGLSGYPNTKTDRYWYCFDYDGHCKDFYFVNGV